VTGAESAESLQECPGSQGIDLIVVDVNLPVAPPSAPMQGLFLDLQQMRLSGPADEMMLTSQEATLLAALVRAVCSVMIDRRAKRDGL
jgi:hypothetical protein